MDLRIIKTKNNIQEAFLKIRAKNALKKIKVTDLCKMALINKTTFYKYYQDIYALSEEIEDAIIAECINDLKGLDYLNNDPYEFINGLLDAFSSRKEQIMIMFSDRLNVLIDKVEKILKMYWLPENYTPEEYLKLCFFIGGGTRVLLNSEYEEAEQLKILADIYQKIIIENKTTLLPQK
jgi:AcrR family transcriptional regulator